MQINIAVPDNPVFNELLTNKETVEKLEGSRIVKVPEARCHELLFSNRVDAALISPLGYGLGLDAVDLRVINGPILASYGYTGLASVFFRKDISEINTCVANDPDEYMMIIAKMILAERYNVHSPMGIAAGSSLEMLKNADTAVAWEKSCNDELSLDVSELWADSFNIPLVLGFWVCHAEEYPPNIARTVFSLADKSLEPEREVVEDTCPDPDAARRGKIIYQWNDDVEYALDQNIHLLYYHQLIKEIAAVKILGRD